MPRLNTNTRIQNAVSGASVALGQTLDTLDNTAAYKVYTGTLSSGSSTATLDVYTDLGRMGSRGFIVNDSTGGILNVSFSVDGIVYGDTFPILSQDVVDIDSFVIFKSAIVNTTGSSVAPYRAFIV